MSRKTAILVITALGLGIAAAQAHPKLQSTMPARDAKLNAAPKEIRMAFSEGLIANFTGLELKNGGGKVMSTGKAMLVPGDNHKIVVPITAKLAPGAYTVAWHAVSVDTHRVTGNYSFKVVR
jgi:methionine-rich copper-binding protein CopC